VDPPVDSNNNNNNNNIYGNRATAAAALQAEGEEEFVVLRVGPPLRRPPAGWDIRTPNQSVRISACVEIVTLVGKHLLCSHIYIVF